MPNLLISLMPGPTTSSATPLATGGLKIGVNSAELSGGSPFGQGAISFPEALGEQLANATSWLNLAPDGTVPAALLLPTGGNALPLAGAELQPELDASGLLGALDGVAPALAGLPLLPPGLAPLDAGATGEEDLVLATTRQGLQLSLPTNPGTGRGQAGAGVAALLPGAPESTKMPPLQTTFAINSTTERSDPSLLQMLGEAAISERAALQRGNDPLALRGIVNNLQGGDNLVHAAPALNPVVVPSMTTATATVSHLPQFTIDVPPGQPGWGEALGDRVNWMLNNQQPGAQLRINPPHLGPLEIKVSVHNDQASITFTAHHAATADSLEAALPRLRELLADHGLQLAQFDVRHQGEGAQAQSGEGDGAAGQGEPAGGTGERDGDDAVTVTTRLGDGLLDTYA